ncbi:MAG: TonB-dependent receptor [Bacteroidales bacterium]|jgi:iron complex outermembrane receptor protein
MRKTIILLLNVFWAFFAYAQEQDTVSGLRVKLEEVVVTATRTKRLLKDIPAQVQVIGREEIESFPVSNIDDLLKSSANINVNRSWGIFSKNSSVTMHGLPGSARILVLVDGVPKNKIAGGSLNWHNINPDNIERIEIIKGPASALYGNNAMGGVINIITKKPIKKLEGSVQAFSGTYKTLGSSLNLSGNETKNGKGFYWNLNGFYRKGDGYYLDPPDFLDPTDVKTFLKEYGGGAMLGYRFGQSDNLELFCDYYNEKRGAGLRIHLDDGSYESTITRQIRSKYTRKIGGGELSALIYFTDEQFYGQKESINELQEYRLLDSYSYKTDKGFWTTWSQELFKQNRLTTGAEAKFGSVDGQDIYRTSTDMIGFRSKMDIFGFFIQDEIGLVGNRLKLIAGLRNDLVSFHDGYQNITDPTKATGFSKGFSETFNNNRWNAFSPKLSLQYSISSRSQVYLSAGTGYIPPDLKDLSQTGKIRKGFRLANPELKPERLTNYEIGFSQLIAGGIKINGAAYYSDGHDFQYMIGTSDSIDTGGGTLKPVLKPENIARIAVLGGEITGSWYISSKLSWNMSYSYNNSRITEFGKSQINPDKDLAGKYLLEVSPHQFYSGITYRNKSFSANMNCNYVDEQWFDDENTILIDDYFVVNMRLSETIKKHYRIYLDIQNILNTEFIDRKGQLSPGRFMTIGFHYIL